MIVVEGCDGSGKTTLIQAITKRFDVELMPRFSDSVEGPKPQLWRLIEDDLRRWPNPKRLYDRYPLISEPIYSSVLRDGPQWGIDAPLGQWWSTFIACSPLIIICLPPLGRVRANIGLNAESQMEGVVDKIDVIWQMYLSLCTMLKAVDASRLGVNTWKVQRHDYTRSGSQENALRSVDRHLTQSLKVR